MDGDKAPKKYIVAAVMDIDGNELDHYWAFTDGTSKENKDAATRKYNELLNDEKCYSANLTKILKSSDYL